MNELHQRKSKQNVQKNLLVKLNDYLPLKVDNPRVKKNHQLIKKNHK
jgi:hypothetical protein